MGLTKLVTVFGVVAVFMAVFVVFTYGIKRFDRPLTLVDQGRQVFRLQGCASCHAVGGGLSRGPDLAGLIPRLETRLSDNGYRKHLGELKNNRPSLYQKFSTQYDEILAAEGDSRLRAWFLRHLQNPRFDLYTGMMPSYGHLTEEQLDALTAFIFTFR